MFNNRWFRYSVLGTIYILGVIGIIATGGGGDSENGCDCPSPSCPPVRLTDGPVYSTALALDGSGQVYVGGRFIQFGSCVANSFLHLTQSGRMDKCIKLPPGFEGGRIYSVAAATDGSGDIFTYLIKKNSSGTYDTYFVRLNSDGSMDANFTAPIIEGAGLLNAIVPTVDGSGDIYIGGRFRSYGGQYFRLARINSDGSLDTHFSGPIWQVYSITLATDGSGDIYAGGIDIDSDNYSYGTVVRFGSDGSIDSDFTIGSGFNNAVRSIALAPDGSGDIYVGGSFTEYDGVESNRIVRLNSDGSRDLSFDVGAGFNGNPNWTPSVIVYDISTAKDGSGDIYVGGSFESYDGAASRGITRLNSDGSKDASFQVGSGFHIQTYISGAVYNVTPVTDGTGYVYVGGIFSNYQDNPTATITRLFSNGSRDGSFQHNTGPRLCN